jgi:flagellar hook-associated protein 2
MAEGVLGLGTGASSLNNELIEKLKEAERKSTVAPLELDIENITGEGGESEKIAEILAKANELLETIKPFDLFVTGGQTAFDNKTANVTGSSVVFDAVDAGSINEGTTSVNISKLAQRDVFQTDTFVDSTAVISSGSGDMITLSQSDRPVYQSDITVASSDLVDASGGNITIDSTVFAVTTSMTYSELAELINEDENFSAKISTSGRLSITSSDEKTALSITEALNTNTIGGLNAAGEKFSTEGVTYEELAASINNNSNYNVSVEAVGINSNRIVIKSSELGTDNAISITQTGVDLGLTDAGNHTVTAQNLNATVDGISYDISSNVFIVDGGLKITAIEENEPGEFSTISVNKDTTTIEPALQLFVSSYNELVSLVEDELYSSDSKIEDKATLRSMMSDIKDKLFGSYDTDDSLNIFNFGFEIDKSGVLSLDSEKFNGFTETDIDSLKSLFVGVAEDRGLGTQLKEYVDSLDGFEGLLSTYQTNIDARKVSLEEEKEKAIESLDNKYSLLSQQFAAYGTIINQFEAQFAGLKLMIQQSVST